MNNAPYNAGEYKNLFVPYTVAQATSSNGRFTAMLTDIGPGTTYILEKAGIKPEDMNTWEGYFEAGKKLKAFDKNINIINNAVSANNLIIRSNLAAGEGIYFDSKGTVLVGPDNARFVKAFTIAKKIREAGIDAKIGEWTNEWYEGFQKGTVATQFSGAW